METGKIGLRLSYNKMQQRLDEWSVKIKINFKRKWFKPATKKNAMIAKQNLKEFTTDNNLILLLI